MDEKELAFLKEQSLKSKKSRQLITTLKLDNGSEYAIFKNGDIYEVLKDGSLKKVNDILDKDNRLKEKILGRFDDTHNSDVIYTNETDLEESSNISSDEFDLPEL